MSSLKIMTRSLNFRSDQFWISQSFSIRQRHPSILAFIIRTIVEARRYFFRAAHQKPHPISCPLAFHQHIPPGYPGVLIRLSENGLVIFAASPPNPSIISPHAKSRFVGEQQIAGGELAVREICRKLNALSSLSLGQFWQCLGGRKRKPARWRSRLIVAREM
jgi:hypothetical protein